MAGNAPRDGGRLDPAAWEALVQRKGESGKAHAAFLDYVRLGAGRSLKTLLVEYRRQNAGEAAAGKPPTVRLRTLELWSSKHQWQARLQAYSEERARQEQAVWEERRRTLQETAWQRGGELLALADRILDHAPLFDGKKRRVRGHDGAPDTIVESVALKAEVALKAIELAVKLQRDAAGAPPVVRMEHVGPDGGPIQTAGVVVYIPDNGRPPVPVGESVPDGPTGDTPAANDTPGEGGR